MLGDTGAYRYTIYSLIKKKRRPNGRRLFLAEEGRFELPLQISPD